MTRAAGKLLGTTTWAGPVRVAASTRRLTARSARSASGWRTVVNAGRHTVAQRPSSNPTIEMSPGQLKPSDRAASMAPNAISSFAQHTPVGRSGARRSAVIPARPVSGLNGPSNIHSGRGSAPPRFNVSR